LSHALNAKVLEMGIFLGPLADSAAATKLRVMLNAPPHEPQNSNNRTSPSSVCRVLVRYNQDAVLTPS
jgi:hypothetical protein